jgi:hypothetical protein
MSAALQLPLAWAAAANTAPIPPQLLAIVPAAPQHLAAEASGSCPGRRTSNAATPAQAPEAPAISWAFYRKHTQSLLRRYLYASMQVGRAPNLLGESVGRGWVSSRRVRTFEDALIFVLDVERCLQRLSPLDRQMISRILLQEYTQTEAAALIGISVRSICTKLPQAIDRLTEALVHSGLLILPD